jgi:HEAT repeat protein
MTDTDLLAGRVRTYRAPRLRGRVAALVAGCLVPAALCTLSARSSAAQVIEQFEQDSRNSRAGARVEAIRALVASRHAETALRVAPLLKDPDRRVQLEALDGILTLYLSPAPSDRQSKPFDVRNGSIAEAVFDAAPLAVLPRPLAPDVFTALEGALSDDDQAVRVSAAFTLGTLASPAVAPLSAEARDRFAERLVYLFRHDDPATREALVRMAGRLFDSPPGRSGPVVIGDALIAAMNDADPRVRVWAIDALGWLRYERAVQALMDRLSYLQKGDEAAASLHALARIAHASSARVFQEHVNDRRAPFRVIALEGLGRLRAAASASPIANALSGTRDERVLVAGAFALHLLGQGRNLDAVVSALARPATSRQAQAYLTELGAAIAPDLHPWLRHHDPALRQAVAEVIGLTAHAGSEEALRAAARDADRAVAETARQALTRIRTLPDGVRVH